MRLETVDKNITVQSSSIDLGSSLPGHVRDSVFRVASKYFGRLNTASVHFNREGITYRCSVNMQIGWVPHEERRSGETRTFMPRSMLLWRRWGNSLGAQSAK